MAGNESTELIPSRVFVVFTNTDETGQLKENTATLASFPGHRRNGLGNSGSPTVYGCNIRVIAEWGFPARGSNCLLLVLLLK